ncbi:TraB/GumN family protein [Frateuria aurantia]|uniref:Pheromone shutdown-related protein TraB n=1 Tax=Frateuria aurantia (strain ATCC 33424 / DSM 6220 / KCTC 2777 / LMG 1558 / NBRC 3245 / NCIMB 13370) TaxID=767434 RepID=H8L0V1_FRAAD|nr:TraB/GumN family protein [Frateuria aurantia]AFC85357.1 pheromone shutdown-related protein TraB [Frateuria aurantia DSM 6220]
MSAVAPAQAGPDALNEQPLERVVRDDIEYVVLGTAHVSPASVAAVKTIIDTERFDAIAVELCPSRAASMRDPEAFRQMDLFQVIRQGKTGLVAASLILSSFQKRLADQYGIEPGAEMLAAMDGAEAQHRPLWLVDRTVSTTLRRAWHNVGWWQRMGLAGGLLGSVFDRSEVPQQDIEQLKQRDLLEGAFSEFASQSEPLYRSLIAERDSYMAARLREEAASLPPRDDGVRRKVLVVIGAGHLQGLVRQIREQQQPPVELCRQLDETPAPARWPKWLALGLVLAIFATIGYAFYRNPSLGTHALEQWILLTGGLAAAGAIMAGGHPLSVVAAFVAAPLKPFRPGIPSGAVSAMVEAALRRPRVADFDTLRDDISHWRGWWKNRVARVLLNFFLVCFGTIAGEYIAGFHILSSVF